MSAHSRSRIIHKKDCDCPNSKGKELIVIKIETCCKRTCDAKNKCTGDGSSTKAVRSSPELFPGDIEEAEELKVLDQRRLFKLPTLVDRHHGPGCAMEISVLEKHEDTCMYKKEEGEGRSIDDRVGSYECVGRLVFRTCNSAENDSDTSGVTGGFTGVTPEDYAKTMNGRSLPASQSAMSPVYRTPRREPPSSRQSSRASQFGSARSFYNESSDQGLRSTDDEDITQERQARVDAARRRMKYYQNYQVLLETHRGLKETPAPEKQHFPGDDCKLHFPKNPLLMGTNHFDKIYSSKKSFPGYSDEGNQTEALPKQEGSEKSKESLETITSLTDLSKSSDKKKSFFGSWFRRNTGKTPNYFGSKKFRS